MESCWVIFFLHEHNIIVHLVPSCCRSADCRWDRCPGTHQLTCVNCRWFIPFVHCTTKLCYPRFTYSSLRRNQVLNVFSLDGPSQLICCLLDLFTEREVSAKLVGPGTRSGSACPRSPFSLREANGRVSISFDLVKPGTQYTYRRIHNSLVRCSAFDITLRFTKVILCVQQTGGTCERACGTSTRGGEIFQWSWWRPHIQVSRWSLTCQSLRHHDERDVGRE